MKKAKRTSATSEQLLADIQAKCRDCCGGSRNLVKACTDTSCRLWPHRCAQATAQVVMFADADLPGQIDIFSMEVC